MEVMKGYAERICLSQGSCPWSCKQLKGFSQILNSKPYLNTLNTAMPVSTLWSAPVYRVFITNRIMLGAMVKMSTREAREKT